jgi:hypothetical protein
MKKYLLLVSCSFAFVASAEAMDVTSQLKAMKEIYLNDFQKMDANGDGVLSKDEFLAAQFENFRANIIGAEGFDKPSEESLKEEREKLEQAAPVVTEEEPKINTLSDVTATLEDMANYDISAELEAQAANRPAGLTKEDVMPKTDEELTDDLPELSWSAEEKENLKKMMENAAAAAASMEETKVEIKEEPASEEQTEDEKKAALNDQMEVLVGNIKQALPKKIDNVTTWTDITYKDQTVNYIYQADADMGTYTEADKEALRQNIEKQACSETYTQMCDKIKSIFIDKGVSLNILYQDKNNADIASCHLDKETCQ